MVFTCDAPHVHVPLNISGQIHPSLRFPFWASFPPLLAMRRQPLSALALACAFVHSVALYAAPEAKLIAPALDGRAAAPAPAKVLTPAVAKDSVTNGYRGTGWDGKRGLDPVKDAKADAAAAAERIFQESTLDPEKMSRMLLTAEQKDSDVALCPTCGKNSNNVPNCCSAGGSWENTCTNSPEEPGSQHTWAEGFNACSHETPPAEQQSSQEAASSQKEAPKGGSAAAGGKNGTKPLIEPVPIPLENEPGNRKCDSEREEWCDGYLSSGEIAASEGSALKPGGNPKGCIAKIDILGKETTDDDWCATNCGMLVPNCPTRLCVCDDTLVPDEDAFEASVDEKASKKPLSPFAKAFDNNVKTMEKIRKAREKREDEREAKKVKQMQRPAETDAELTKRMKRQLDENRKKGGKKLSATEIIVGPEAAAAGRAAAHEAGEEVAQPTQETEQAKQKAWCDEAHGVSCKEEEPPPPVVKEQATQQAQQQQWQQQQQTQQAQQTQQQAQPAQPPPQQQAPQQQAPQQQAPQQQAPQQAQPQQAQPQQAQPQQAQAQPQQQTEPPPQQTQQRQQQEAPQQKQQLKQKSPKKKKKKQQQQKEDPDAPKDESADCPAWAEMGECTKNPAYMATGCPVSCHGKLPGESPEEIKRQLEESAPATSGDLGGSDQQQAGGSNGEELDEDGRDSAGRLIDPDTGLVTTEYADSSGIPEGADAKTCVAVSQVSNEWCRNNCASKPPTCPAKLCSCKVRDPNDEKKKKDEQEACGPEVGVRCGQTVFDGTGALTGYNTIHDASEVAGAKPAWGSLTPATDGG